MKNEIKTLLARAPLLDVFGLHGNIFDGYYLQVKIFSILTGQYDESHLPASRANGPAKYPHG